MHSKIIAAILVSILVSCQRIGFLPKPNQVGIWPYGGMIVGRDTNQSLVKGELIAIDSGKIYVLVQNANSPNRTLVSYPTSKFNFQKIQYANKTDRMGSAIPLSLLASFTGGYFFILTFPINLITTLSVVHSGNLDYQYTNKNKPDQLQMFARFPQGIPPGVNLSDIH